MSCMRGGRTVRAYQARLQTEHTVYSTRAAVSARGYNREAAFRLGPVRRATLYATRQARRGGPPIYIKLQNEANFPGCWRMWMGFMDRVLEVKVRQFVTWLRFAGMASFGGYDPQLCALCRLYIGSLRPPETAYVCPSIRS
jgi:hypothetical protein